jgi:AcrR family transcriptional regulator
MKPPAKSRDPGHEANRVAALTATLERRRVTVAATLERCALELFLAAGIEAVSVDDIAREAGISRRTFYRYFESPIDILRQVFCRSMDGWVEKVRERPVGEALLTSFGTADSHALTSPGNAGSMRLALAVMGRSPEAWARISGPMQAHTTRAYRQIIAERLTASGRDPAMAGAIAAGLTGIMVHLAEQSARENRALDPGEFEAALRAFQDMIANPGPGSALL